MSSYFIKRSEDDLSAKGVLFYASYWRVAKYYLSDRSLPIPAVEIYAVEDLYCGGFMLWRIYAVEGYAVHGYAMEHYAVEGYTVEGFSVEGYATERCRRDWGLKGNKIDGMQQVIDP